MVTLADKIVFLAVEADVNVAVNILKKVTDKFNI